MIILILGPDGVGKTTISQKIADLYDFEYYYGGPRNPATNLLKKRQQKAHKKVVNNQEKTISKKQTLIQKIKSKIMRYLSLFLLLYDGYVKLKFLKKNNKNYILDRSVIDLFIQNEEMWKLPFRDYFLKYFGRYFKKVFLLYVKPDVVYERKQELNIKEIQKQFERYKYIVKLLNGKIVENYNIDKTTKEIYGDIKRSI